MPPSGWIRFKVSGAFHSSYGSGGTEVVLVVQRAVNAGNDFEGKGAELVVLSATNRNQLFFRYAVGPHHIFGALGANHCGASFESDVGTSRTWS